MKSLLTGMKSTALRQRRHPENHAGALEARCRGISSPIHSTQPQLLKQKPFSGGFFETFRVMIKNHTHENAEYFAFEQWGETPPGEPPVE